MSIRSTATACRAARCEALAQRVVAALPGLRGFAGIDLVWHPQRGPVVIEVNPRLTVAYAGSPRGLAATFAAELLARAWRTGRRRAALSRMRRGIAKARREAPSAQAQRIAPATAAAESPVFGWDVGGAHVKVSVAARSGALARRRASGRARCGRGSRISSARSILCSSAGRPRARRRAPRDHDDGRNGRSLSQDRAEACARSPRTLAQRLGPRTLFYAGAAGWLARSACAGGWRKVASANWLATARWVATRKPECVLVDIGSTTTDIIPVVEGRVAAREFERTPSGSRAANWCIRAWCARRCVASRTASRFGGETTGVDERMVRDERGCLSSDG